MKPGANKPYFRLHPALRVFSQVSILINVFEENVARFNTAEIIGPVLLKPGQRNGKIAA
jgi:hypothetical protein